MSGIGLCGTHRVGKSTLAEAWSKSSGVEYVPFSTAAVTKAVSGGYCDAIDGIERRLMVQQALVDECHRQFMYRRTAFITDRSPIDVAAYTMADMMQGEMSADQQAQAMQIVTSCIDICNFAFEGMVLIFPSPKIPFKAEVGKPKPNIPYQWHIHYLIHGMLNDPRLECSFWFMDSSVSALKRRVSALDKVREVMLEDDIELAQSLVLN